MKKIFTFLMIIIVLVVVGLVVFVATFDANRYKPMIEEKIAEAIKKDVKIGDISLSFLFGPALSIDTFAMKETRRTWRKPILEAESITLRVKLLPLIGRDIQLDQLLIKDLKVMRLGDRFENVELRAEKKAADVIVHRFTGRVAGGSFVIKGRIEDMFSRQHSDFQVRLEDLQVGRFIPEGSSDRPEFEGRVNLKMDISAKGLAPKAILDSMTAEGTVDLDRASLKNINVLSVALDKLDMLPGLVDRLKDSLPSRYSELLKDEHTDFKPIDAKFNIENKKMFFKDIEISSDAFYLVVNKGELALNRNIKISSNIFIPRDLSKAFTGVVDELKYLEDEKGMITMPLSISGKVPKVSIRPDIDYVLQRVIVSKGVDLIKDILIPDKLKERTQKPQETETGGEISKEPEDRDIEPAEVIIKSIFDIITAPRD